VATTDDLPDDDRPDAEVDDRDEDDEEFVLPPAHPDFLRAFPGDLYDDQADEFAPFGSDEGWDAMAEIVEDLMPLDPDVTLRQLSEEVLELVDEEFEATDPDETADSDFAVIGVGFTILRLTGRIDAEGRQWLIDAIGRHQSRFGDDVEALQRIAADLRALPVEEE
jgi:uncharacterized protein YfeS